MLREYFLALKNYANFSGRATRKEYWMFILYNTIIGLLIGVPDIMISGPKQMVSHIYSLIMFVPSLAVGVRRLHDTNRSGWWLLVPIANIVFLCQASEEPGSEGHKGISGWGIFALIFFGFIPVLGIVAAIAIPAYQDYVVRARMVEVTSVIKDAERSVGDYMMQYGHSPSDIADTKFSTRSRFVKSVEVNPDTAVVSLTLSFQPLIDKVITLEPSDTKGNVNWECHAADIRPSQLPADCRH